MEAPAVDQDRVEADIAYLGPMSSLPYFYARDHERDNLALVTRRVAITNMRGRRTSLDVEGFVLVDHPSAVRDFTDQDAVQRLYVPEIRALIQALTGARTVVATGAVLR